MVMRKNTGEKIFDAVNAVFMTALMIITLYPFLHVAFSSVSSPLQLSQHTGPLLYPKGFTLTAYHMVFKNPMISLGYMNTLFYVIVGTAVNLLLTSLGAYVLSRKDLFWKDAITFLMVFTMFFSGGLIPNYLLVNDLGLFNSRWALILPSAISTFNMIIMRTSFAAIPDSLEESATIDGANEFIVLFRIILPLSLPIIAVMVLFYGVGHWNAWFHAMIYLRSRQLYPLQLILREILISNSVDSMTTGVASGDKEPVGESVKYATIMVATLPILFIYPFLQKYFVKGVMIGAIKE